MPRTGLWNAMSDEEKQSLVQMYLDGTSLWGLHREFGVNAASVKRYMHERGIHTRDRSEAQRDYYCDESAFDGVLSPEAQYWVGMLITDGCVGLCPRAEPRIILTLKRGDKDHLVKFLSFMKSDYPIYDKTKLNKKTGVIHYTSAVALRSALLAMALAEYGVVPRKSKTCEAHRLEWSKDFWRGAIDGDGEINITNRSPRIVFTGSRIITTQFAAFCTYHGVPYPSVVRNNSVFKCQIFGSRMTKILRLLYEGSDPSHTLTRKAEAAKAVLSSYQDREVNFHHPKRQRSLVSKEEIDVYVERLRESLKKENPNLSAGVSSEIQGE